MIKNEADILPLWLAHICAVFDEIFIVDHTSTDGSLEYLRQAAEVRGNINLLSFSEPGYYQQEVTNALAEVAAERVSDGWLFALDADEFIETESWQALASKLQILEPDTIIELYWKNCVPLGLFEDRVLDPASAMLIPPSDAEYKKVAINASMVRDRGWRFFQGNHELLDQNGEILSGGSRRRFGTLLHVPLRSLDQFALKCVQGYLAYQALPGSRESEGQGTHWTDMIKLVAKKGHVDPSVVRAFVKDYGQVHKMRRDGVSVYELVDNGWRCGPLQAPHEPLPATISRSRGFMDLAHDLARRSDFDELRAFLARASGRSRNHDVRDGPAHATASRATAASMARSSDAASDEAMRMALLERFLPPAFAAHENPVPSAWESHVPFLFCLIPFANPRRYVDLGTHYGNSLFAACQASRELGWSVECIGIDTWQGDEHTGGYEDDVFREFEYVLQRDYAQCGKYMRMTFDEACGQVEDRSVDLLHIDGLHTYEAVAHDFRTWLPKVSDRGIVMFHDTRVYDRGFGVWRLWSEISRLYPSFEFEHGHGLGVLLVGENAPPQVKSLFEIFAKPRYLELARLLFSQLGSMSPIGFAPGR